MTSDGESHSRKPDWALFPKESWMETLLQVLEGTLELQIACEDVVNVGVSGDSANFLRAGTVSPLILGKPF